MNDTDKVKTLNIETELAETAETAKTAKLASRRIQNWADTKSGEHQNQAKTQIRRTRDTEKRLLAKLYTHYELTRANTKKARVVIT